MVVELLIVSGTQLGHRWTFHQDTVSVGGGRHWDGCFHTRQDPGAQGKRAPLLADQAGWRLQNDGEMVWFVNQELVPTGGACPIRARDMIRLSELGPGLRFMVLAEDGETPPSA